MSVNACRVFAIIASNAGRHPSNQLQRLELARTHLVCVVVSTLLAIRTSRLEIVSIAQLLLLDAIDFVSVMWHYRVDTLAFDVARNSIVRSTGDDRCGFPCGHISLDWCRHGHGFCVLDR